MVCQLALLSLFSISIVAQTVSLSSRRTVASGWHPWYEIQADPENRNHLIVCGTKWDAVDNAPVGFAYTSADGGITWRRTLVDRSTAWVTEHSCAFGPSHRAYMISEASKVIDGSARHQFGTTRLFVSQNAGGNWHQTVSTGWADYSTSAFSSAAGRLYTFYNDSDTADRHHRLGSSVALLVFSRSGRKARGPYTPPGMRHINYVAAFPSKAVALADGSVVALYYGIRQSSSGRMADLGLVRASPSPTPFLSSTLVRHLSLGEDGACTTLADNTMAYDKKNNRLVIVYLNGCSRPSELWFTSSNDGGWTWSKSEVLLDAGPSDELYAPSLAVSPRGVLALLWKQGRSRILGYWSFSLLKGDRLTGSPVQLSRGLDKYAVSSETLETSVRNNSAEPNALPPLNPTIALSVFNQLNTTWRVSGLVATAEGFLAVWPSGDADGTGLYCELLARSDFENSAKLDQPPTSGLSDVTREMKILYGGEQDFDVSTGTLHLCLSLLNRGSAPIGLPMRLQAEDVESDLAPVSILNASNHSLGAGAVWDISASITGGRIRPGSTSRPFCLSFHLDLNTSHAAQPASDLLLGVRLRILASKAGSR